MIINRSEERLVTKGYGCKRLADYVQIADDMQKGWDDRQLIRFGSRFPLELNTDAKVEYAGRTEDISEYAFAQLCSKVGIPAAYIRKCMDTGREELALSNYRSFAHSDPEDRKKKERIFVRSYNGVVRGILSDAYNVFDNNDILHQTADVLSSPEYSGRYDLNQIYLSEDRLHMRFVDFNNPIHQDNGSKFYTGFTVSSSSVGAGSFNVKYFVYRFACKNGIVVIKNGGILYRQTHLTQFGDHRKDLIAAALGKVDEMNLIAKDQLIASEKKILTYDEMEALLEKARKELHFGRKESAEMLRLRNTLVTLYPENTVASLANAITEHVQEYDTLDRRIEGETWAGNLIMAA